MFSGVPSAKSAAPQEAAVRTKAPNFIRQLYRAYPETPRIGFDCVFFVSLSAHLLHSLQPCTILLFSYQAFVAASIFFVWGVRHSSVAEEFKQDKLPNWPRDFLAILKVTGAILLLVGINRPRAAIFGVLMIAVLMAAAVFTHLRLKNPPLKALLSAALLVCSLAAAYLNYRLNLPT
jgi:hypothetical protein